MVGVEEERTSADAACEPLGLCKADDEGAEVFLKRLLIQFFADVCERFGGLLTYDRLVRLRKRFQKGQEDGLVRENSQLPDTAELLGDGKENFVILVLDQGLKVRNELRDRLVAANGEDDSFQAMDRVDLQVDFLSLHFLFQESESVYVFDHRCCEGLG